VYNSCLKTKKKKQIARPSSPLKFKKLKKETAKHAGERESVPEGGGNFISVARSRRRSTEGGALSFAASAPLDVGSLAAPETLVQRTSSSATTSRAFLLERGNLVQSFFVTKSISLALCLHVFARASLRFERTDPLSRRKANSAHRLRLGRTIASDRTVENLPFVVLAPPDGEPRLAPAPRPRGHDLSS